MKLHLPNSLRRALISCLAAVPAIFPTLATGAIGGGLLTLSFYASVPLAQAVGEDGEEGEAAPVTYSGTVYTWVGSTVNIHDIPNYRASTQDAEGSWTLASEAPSSPVTCENTWYQPATPNTIRFVEGDSYMRALTFTFYELRLGGIIVEEGADDYSIGVTQTDIQRAIVIAGGTDSIAASIIKEDFRISNANSSSSITVFTLSGQLAWDIAEGKTFTLAGKGGVDLEGDLTVSGGGAAAFTNGLKLESGSTLTIEGGSSVVVSGTFANNGGTVNNSAENALILQNATANNLSVSAGSYYALAESVTLSGTVTLGEGSTLDITHLTSLSLGSDTLPVEGSGTVSDAYGAVPHIFMGDETNLNRYAVYNAATHSFVVKDYTDEQLIHWGGAGENDNWSTASNWQAGDTALQLAPGKTFDLRLLAANNGTITIDGDISQNRLIFGDGADYTFSIDPEHDAALKADSIIPTGEAGAAHLTKAGEGSLTMTLAQAQALGVTVSAGSLVLSDAAPTSHVTIDLRALTVANGADVELALCGSRGSSNHTILNLGEGFQGSLTIQSGSLYANSSTSLDTVSGFILVENAGFYADSAISISQDITIQKDANINTRGSFTHTGKLIGDSDAILYTYGFGGTGSNVILNDLTEFHGSLNLTVANTVLAGNQGNINFKGILLNKWTNASALTIEAGTDVHITGTENSAQETASFMLAYGSTDAAVSTVLSIAGSLESEAGISTLENKTGTINVQGGGVLQLNQGVRGESNGTVTVNVAAEGTLKVSGADSATTGNFTLALADGATLRGGAAGTDATVKQNITLADNATVHIGTENGKTLTLSASALSTVSGGTLHILGDDAGGRVVLDSLAGSTELQLESGSHVELTRATSLTRLEVAAGSTATLGGSTTLTGEEGLIIRAGGTAILLGAEVVLSDLTNEGTLDLTGLTHLTVTALQQANALVQVGSFTLAEGVDIMDLLTPVAGLRTVYDADRGIIYTEAAGEDVFRWVGTAENHAWAGATWQAGEAESEWVGGSDVLLGLDADVSKTITLADGDAISAGSITVADAYSLEVLGDATATLDAGSFIFSERGSLEKTGSGTLQMTAEDATSARLYIAEGTLYLTDTLAGEDASHDLSPLTSAAAGRLSVSLAPGGSALTMGEGFTGTLDVRSGLLAASSSLGGVSTLGLQGGSGIIAAGDGENSLAAGTFAAGSGRVTLLAEAGAAGSLEGAWTGTAATTLAKTGDGQFILTGDLSAFAGTVEVQAGSLAWNSTVTSESPAMAGLSLADGTELTVASDYTAATQALTLAGDSATISGGGDVYATELSGAGAGKTLNLAARLRMGSDSLLGTLAAGSNAAIGGGHTLTIMDSVTGSSLAVTDAGTRLDMLTYGLALHLDTLTLEEGAGLRLGTDASNASTVGTLYSTGGTVLGNPAERGYKLAVGQLGYTENVHSLNLAERATVSMGSAGATGALSLAAGNRLNLSLSGGSSFEATTFTMAAGSTLEAAVMGGSNLSFSGAAILQGTSSLSVYDNAVFTAQSLTVQGNGTEAVFAGGGNAYIAGNISLSGASHTYVREGTTLASTAGNLVFKQNATLHVEKEGDTASRVSVNGNLTTHSNTAVTGGGTLSVGGNVTVGNGCSFFLQGGALLEAGGQLIINNGSMEIADSRMTVGVSLVQYAGSVLTLTGNSSLVLESAAFAAGALLQLRDNSYVSISKVDPCYGGTTIDVGEKATLEVEVFTFATRDPLVPTSITGSGTVKIGEVNGKDNTPVNISGVTMNVARSFTLGADSRYTFREGATAAVAGNMVFGNGSVLEADHSTVTIGGNIGGVAQGTVTITGDSGTVRIEGDWDMVDGMTLSVGGAGTQVDIIGGGDCSRVSSGVSYTLAVGAGAVVNDTEVRQTGGSFTVTGEGTYNAAAYVLGAAEGSSASELHLQGGVTMNISGSLAEASHGGSFVLANAAGSSPNRLVIEGSTLNTEAAMTTRGNDAEIQVAGGRLQFNNGLANYGDGHRVSLAVDGASTLAVSGTDTTGAESISLSLGSGATVELGTAGKDTRVVANNMEVQPADGETKGQLNIGAYGGADVSSEFASSAALELDALHILGTEAGADGQLVLNLNLTATEVRIDAGARVTLDGAYTLTSAIRNDGDLRLASSILLDIATLGYVKGDNGSHIYTFVTGDGSLAADLGINNFMYNGTILSIATLREASNGEYSSVRIADGQIILSSNLQYWKGSGTWDTSLTAWNTDDSASDAAAAFEAGSAVEFGNGGSKAVTVAADGVSAPAVYITGEGYAFSGGTLATAAMKADKSVSFANAVTGLDGTLEINIAENATASMETLIGGAGQSLRVTGSGTLRVTGTGGTWGALAVGANTTFQLGGEGKEASLNAGHAALSSAGGTVRNLSISGNSLSAATPENGGKATLHNIHLTAGTEDAFVSISDLVFSGSDNTLGGYITIGDIDSTGIWVAEGSSLAMEKVVFDLGSVPLGSGHTIIGLLGSEGNMGAISNWDLGHVTFQYNGAEIVSGLLSLTEPGKVAIDLSQDTGFSSPLYWTGTDGSGWNASSLNWNEMEGAEGAFQYKAFADVYFGALAEDGVKDVRLESSLPTHNLVVGEGGYSFSGNTIKTYGNLVVSTESGSTSFISVLDVLQDMLVQSGSGAGTAAAKSGDLEVHGRVHIAGDLDVSSVGLTQFHAAVEVGKEVRLGNHDEDVLNGITTAVTFADTLKAGALTVQRGTAAAPEAVKGTYTFQDIDVTRGTVTFNVDDMRMGGTNDAVARVQVNGTLTAQSVYILGNAAKTFSGAITADLVHISAGGDDHNLVVFDALNNTIKRLELVDGAKLSITKSVNSSSNSPNQYIDVISIGDAVLRFDMAAGRYTNGGKGYTIYSTHDNALLELAGITYTTIKTLSGREAEDGERHSFTIDSKGRQLIINGLEDLKDLTIRSGTAEIAAAAAGNAIYRDFIIQDTASVNLKASNVMAAGSGQIRISDSFLQLNTTEQKLYAAANGAGNSLSLDRAHVLGGNASTVQGIHVVQAAEGTAGSLTVGYNQSNTISANMTLEAETETRLAGSAGSSLTLSGLIAGAGNMAVEGAGSTVTVSGAANTLTGTVTVEQGAELVLAHQSALQNAHLVMKRGSTLTLDTKGRYPITLDSLRLGNNATINIDRLTGTAAVDASMAAFELGYNSVEDGGALTLNFTFGEGVRMDTVTTYNLFSSTKQMNTGGKLGELNIWYHDGSGGLVQLNSDHYTYGYRSEGGKYVFYIRTRFGNVWQGGDVVNGSNSGTWSLDASDSFWKDGRYQEEGVAYKDALFVDLEGVTESHVTLVDSVAPGNVYFDAENTAYYLTATVDGRLAADTVIHTSGAGDVHLNLANNATTASAISGMNVHAGTVYLESDLAFSGTIAVDMAKSADETIALNTQGHQLVAGNYTASGVFKGVTLGQEDTGAETKGFITGAEGAPGSITNAVIDVETTVGGHMELSYATLEGTGSLNNVTIGSGVSVGANGAYTLTGVTRFNDALKVGSNATVTIGSDAMVDIGGLTAEVSYGETNTVYTYTLLTDANGGNIPAGTLVMAPPTLGMIMINGVNLENAVGTKVTISQVSDEQGAPVSGKIQITLDGADITQWDERWGISGGGPAVGITNKEDNLLYDGSSSKYLYSNIVAGEGNENLVVASISRHRDSEEEAAPLVGSTGTDKEIWIYNQGTGNFSELVTGSATAGSVQSGATHLMVTGGQTEADTLTVAGSKDATQTGDSYLTIKGDDTRRGIVVGASYGADQSGDSHVFVDGGTIQTMLVAGSYQGNMTGDTHLTITGGSFQKVYGGSYSDEAYAPQGGTGNTESNITVSLTGGRVDTFYGGGTGRTGGLGKALSVTVDGAEVDTLYATNERGSVTGALELNLLSGTAEVVKLAGSGTTVYGDYVVRLGSSFTLGNVTGVERSIKGIYGGRESGSGITWGAAYTSRLELVDAGASYDFFPGEYGGTTNITEIAGFDEIALADAVTLRVDNRYFCNKNDVVISTLTEGSTATVLFGKSNESGSGGSRGGGRTGSITLERGITLKLETSYAYYGNRTYTDMPVLYVGDGATLDLTGFPREQVVDDGEGSISLQIHLAGDGVNGIGAMYKGAGEASASPNGKAAIPYLVLDDNASINAEAASIIVDGWEYVDTYLQLNQNTLTKIGNQTLRFYASQEGARTNTGLTGGTIYVKEGAVDYLKVSQAREVDYVLGKEGTLSLTQHADGTSLVIRSLSGEGTVDLNKNTKLTLESDYKTSQGVFYDDWLGEGKYNNANSGGFAYGVFSGTIVSSDSSVELIKTGEGTQVLSGGDSTYQGLTRIQEGTLYLIGSSTGSLTAPQQSANVEKGVLGKSSLVWESVDGSAPILKLGEGVRIFNDGYAMDGSEMTIEVAAAPQGTSAMDYVVRDADGNPVTITVEGQRYYQMDTTSLKSVNATGFYADASAEGGKDYDGGAIDRNRTLYLSAAELDKTVGDSLDGNGAAQQVTQQLTGCEKIDVGQLESAGLSSLDCKGYYGDGTAYVAGAEIDKALAGEHGLYVAPVDMTATAGQYLAYTQDPSLETIGGTDYVQYNLGRLTDPAAVDEGLRDAPYFAVSVAEKSSYGTNEKVVYMTYEELQELAAAGEEAEESLLSINRVCYAEGAEIPEAAKDLSMVMGEAYVTTGDIDVRIDCLTVKEGVTSVAADGYYVDADGNLIGTYAAGEAIDGTKGTLLIPADKGSQSLVVVTGLNASGYEEATYSGVLSDGGADSPSHFTKIGQGTLTLDQQSIYSGNTNLKEGTLNLKGWAQLQREVERSSSRFIQQEGTSLKLSYDNTFTGEARELASPLEIVGSGDVRWKNEATTEHQTAALISDVGEKVSFTLSGAISGHGNVLHSGAGQLHISGENSYDGGTTITEGVVYVESSTALGDTAGTNMAAKVAVSKHTEDGKGGTLVITNGLGEVDSNGRVGKGYVQFNSNRNAIEGTVIIGGYEAGADIVAGAGANAAGGSTLLMTGNGYWAEKTVISDKSALIFNGAASSNKVMEGEEIIHEAGLLTGSGTLAVSGPMGSGTTVRFASISEAGAEGQDGTASFQGSIYVEGNNAKLEIGSGDYAVGAGQVLSISGYDATVEAEQTAITISDGGRVDMSSYGHEGARGADLDRDAARLVAAGVTVGAGGTFATRNAATTYRYNLAAIERQTQVSTQETLIGHRSGPNPSYEETPEKWVDMREEALALPTELTKGYQASYLQSLAINQNRSSVVDSNLEFRAGSTYEASFANTSLGGHSLTLQALDGDYSAENRINLDLSLNGNALLWGEDGRGISQVVLFTDVSSVTFTYGGQTVNTDTMTGDIFYMAAKDFFYDVYDGRYIDDNTVLVYDRVAQIVYLDAALPEPTTTTLSLLALAALLSRRRRKK